MPVGYRRPLRRRVSAKAFFSEQTVDLCLEIDGAEEPKQQRRRGEFSCLETYRFGRVRRNVVDDDAPRPKEDMPVDQDADHHASNRRRR